MRVWGWFVPFDLVLKEGRDSKLSGKVGIDSRGQSRDEVICLQELGGNIDASVHAPVRLHQLR
jgi:hypothetical protein